MPKLSEPSTVAYLDKLIDKDENELTADDIAFLRARSAYVSKDKLSDINKLPAAKELDKRNKEKEDQENPRKAEGGQEQTPQAQADAVLHGRRVEDVPTKQLNKLAVIYGIPEEKKKDRQTLIEALRTKLGPTAEEKPE